MAEPFTSTSDRVAALEQSVLSGPGETPATIRQAAFEGSASGSLDSYLEKVRHASYRLTDQDIQNLLRSGTSEDAIFELTVAAAMGAASRILAAGLHAIGEQP